jgi:hypothetical protein
VITGNTVWDGQGDLVRADSASFALTATLNHNVEQLFSQLDDSGAPYTVNEDYDIFETAPWTFNQGPHTVDVANPQFVNTAADDYRLASNPSGLGVDWAPASQQYGPS